MITRVCISINNACNLRCKYCHFHEKEDYIENSPMDILKILDNIKFHIKKYEIESFKIGFVGNGEPMLSFPELQTYIDYISEELKKGIISAYTITNGVSLSEDMLVFLKEHNVNVGFSIDGLKDVHDKWRCHSYDKVMSNIELYRKINGKYPSMNCTVGADVIANTEATISFFEQFKNRVTFSRMIGQYGISMSEFKQFMTQAQERLNVRTGGYDCTMYGGLCGAGINNLFYANGGIYICGNCIDMGNSIPYDTPIDEVSFDVPNFDRVNCYKESFT
ncbi:MAG: radical SAM protein [Clostridia bacterium]|nr:radical SAM protein [Clostridia bacterium]